MSGVFSLEPIMQHTAVSWAGPTESKALERMLADIGMNKLCEAGSGLNFVGLAMEDSVLVNETVDCNGSVCKLWSTSVHRAGPCTVGWDYKTNGYILPLHDLQVSPVTNMLVPSIFPNIAYALNMVDENRIEIFLKTIMPLPVHIPLGGAATATVGPALDESGIPAAMVDLFKGALQRSDFIIKWSNVAPAAVKDRYTLLYKRRCEWERLVSFNQLAAGTWTTNGTEANGDFFATRLSASKNKHFMNATVEINNTSNHRRRLYLVTGQERELKPLLEVQKHETAKQLAPARFMQYNSGSGVWKFLLYDSDGHPATTASAEAANFALDLPERVYQWVHTPGRNEWTYDQLLASYKEQHTAENADSAIVVPDFTDDLLTDSDLEPAINMVSTAMA